MSARSVKAFEAHCAAQGRPVPKPVDITGLRRAGSLSRATMLPPAGMVAGSSEVSDVAQRGAVELLRVTKTRQVADERLAVTLTLGELRELVREAALEAVTEAVDAPRPALLDRAALARALAIGVSTVDRFRRDGCPAVWIGDSPRFELQDVIAWLRGRGQP